MPAMRTPKLQLKQKVVIEKGNEAATTTNQFNKDTKVPGKAEGKEHWNNKNNYNSCVKEEGSEWKMECSSRSHQQQLANIFFLSYNFKQSHSIFSSFTLF